MSYVENNLMTGETVTYSSKITRWVYVGPALVTVTGFVIVNAGTNQEPRVAAFSVIGSILFIIGLAKMLNAFMARWTTELAITNKRVIYKSGFIRRNTIELNHAKVESFHVDQGILGRLLDYGTLTINGTGGGKTPINDIDSPLAFRKKAMEAIDARQ